MRLVWSNQLGVNLLVVYMVPLHIISKSYNWTIIFKALQWLQGPPNNDFLVKWTLVMVSKERNRQYPFRHQGSPLPGGCPDNLMMVLKMSGLPQFPGWVLRFAPRKILAWPQVEPQCWGKHLCCSEEPRRKSVLCSFGSPVLHTCLLFPDNPRDKDPLCLLLGFSFVELSAPF